MKNQYFGDLKDLFKYDLMTEVSTRFNIKHIFFIPMLTKNDSSKHGFDTNYIEAIDKKRPGTKNTELMKYLIDKMLDGKRDIREINAFFRERKLNLHIHHEKKGYFTKDTRNQYFKDINLPSECLILFDPDIGLEIGKSDERHLIYAELREIYDNMNNGSITMIFQYIFPRANKTKYISRRLYELAKIGENRAYITDSKIAFLFLTKNSETQKKLMQVLRLYRQQYADNKSLIYG